MPFENRESSYVFFYFMRQWNSSEEGVPLGLYLEVDDGKDTLPLRPLNLVSGVVAR